MNDTKLPLADKVSLTADETKDEVTDKVEVNEEEVISRFKEFAHNSNKRFGEETKRFREDRSFASGDQWSEDDIARRGAGRCKITLNLIDNFKNAIVNPFLSNPFSIEYESTKDKLPNLITFLNNDVKTTFSKYDAKSAVEYSVADQVISGCGFAYGTITKGKAEILAVPDSTMVMRDPNSVELDGSDFSKIAIVEFISKEKCKKLYDLDEDAMKGFLSSFENSWHPDINQVEVITYYEKDDDDTHVYKIVGTKLVKHSVLPGCSIPVYPFYGMLSWKGNKKSFVGITSKLRDAQVSLNIAMTNLQERAARVPKPLFAISKEAVQGNERYYSSIDKGLTPYLPFNSFSSSGQPVTPPIRLDNAVKYDDCIAMASFYVDTMSNLVGIPITGISESLGQQETAESMLLRTRSSQSNVSNFADHTRLTIHQIGQSYLQLVNVISESKIPVDEITTNILSGPQQVTERLDKRRQLLALSEVVPDVFKAPLSYSIAKTFDDEAIGTELSNMMRALLPPEVLSDDPQLEQLKQQNAKQVSDLNDQLDQQKQQIESLTSQLELANAKIQKDLTVAKLNAQNAIDKQIIDSKLSVDEYAKKKQIDANFDLSTGGMIPNVQI